MGILHRADAGNSRGSTVITRLVPSAFGLPGQSAARAFAAAIAPTINTTRNSMRQIMRRHISGLRR